jgi:hypothetical protein
MSGNKTLINILISVVVIVVAFFGYRYLRPSSSAAVPANGLVTTTSSAAKPADASDDFLRILRNLKKVEFKTEVFEMLKASQLKDFTTQLGEQTPGRPNPFAPIGSADRSGSVFTTGGTTTKAATASTTPAKKTTVPNR